MCRSPRYAASSGREGGGTLFHGQRMPEPSDQTRTDFGLREDEGLSAEPCLPCLPLLLSSWRELSVVIFEGIQQ